jgi:hypothetical protein
MAMALVQALSELARSSWTNLQHCQQPDLVGLGLTDSTFFATSSAVTAFGVNLRPRGVATPSRFRRVWILRDVRPWYVL